MPYDGSARLGYPSVTTWLAAWAARDGCTAGPTIFYAAGAVTGEAWSHCQGDGAVIHYRLLGGAHVWPGPQIGRGLASPDAQLNATNVIWSFFQSHRLPSA